MDLTCFNWVQLVKKSDLPANAKYLALYLGTFMNAEHDVAWPSQIRISNETGLARSTVIKWLDYLENHQWLIKHSKARFVPTLGGTQAQNEYLINIPEKVVRESVTLLKGSPSADKRMSDERTKDVRQPDTNNNGNNKDNNNKETHTLPAWLSDELWQSFVDHRKQLKAPMTDRAKTLLIAKLGRIKADGYKIELVINQSIENGWKGVFSVKEQNNGQRDTRSRAQKVSDELDRLAADAIDRGETI